MLPRDLLDTLRAYHQGADRGYHGWDHPLALLKWHGQVEDQLHDPVAVECAIVLHDAIYEPRATDNEHRSAVLARTLLAGVVPTETLDRAVRMIEATSRHAIPDGLPEDEARDMAMFLDMDLSILGASDAAFDAYEAGVRHEYREVPEPLFRAGRAAILEGFFAREHLYFSDWGRGRFEAQARRNLARSIAALRGEEITPTA